MPNNLPLNWCECKFGDFVQILDGNRKPINSVEREQRIANAKMLYPYYGATGQVGYIDDYLIEGSYVLLGEDGAPFLEPFKKKAYIVDGKIWVNNHAHILKGYSGISDKFICYWLNSISYREYVSGTTRLKLNQAMMREIKCKLPPLAEQERIVEKIEALFQDIDEGVERLKSAQAQIKQYRQSVLKSAFEGKLYKTTDWKEVQLKDVCKIISGFAFKSEDFTYNIGTKVIKITNVGVKEFIPTNDTLPNVFLDEYSTYAVEQGDILIALTRSFILEGLKVCICPEAYNKSLLNQRVAAIKVFNIHKCFLFMFLSTLKTLEYVKSKSKNTNQPNLSVKDLQELLIPLPTPIEQQRIVEEIEKRFAVADELEKAVNEGLEKADKLKQSILKKAFEGKLVAQDPNDEPASVLLERIKKEQIPTKGKKK